LICYKIHLIQQNEDVFVYLFKNINPMSIWYDMKIRDGDRLVTLNEQDVTRISYENIYSSIIEKKNSFTCQVVWLPELYIEFGEN
jgi:type II secretory pathway component PulC